MKLILTSALAFTVISLSYPTTQVWAQDSASSSEIILQKQRLEEQIENTRKQLLSQLNNYQQLEKKYRIALDQYQRLQTLTSIEEVLNATKTAMISRNEVLHTYLELNRLQLIEAEGIEIAQKQKVLDRIEQNKEDLSAFRTKLDQELDRQQINNLADEFIPIAIQVRDSSYQALSLLTIGRLQAVFDQAQVVYQNIQEKDSTDENLIQQTARKRSLNEVDKLFKTIAPLLQTQWQALEQVGLKQESYRLFYRGVFDDLNPIYSRISQLIAYLEELEEIK